MLTDFSRRADVSASFVLGLKRPNRMRTEFVVQGQTGVRAFDGQHAWERLPLPGEARYRTPVPGLYLCGAGTHPGGGVGLPGSNAAREILRDLR